jgi:hypothetical protein
VACCWKRLVDIESIAIGSLESDLHSGLALWPLEVTFLFSYHRILANVGLVGVDEDVEGADISTAHHQGISKGLVIARQTKLE